MGLYQLGNKKLVLVRGLENSNALTAHLPIPVCTFKLHLVCLPKWPTIMEWGLTGALAKRSIFEDSLESTMVG
jgi:hypothetical protein